MKYKPSVRGITQEISGRRRRREVRKCFAKNGYFHPLFRFCWYSNLLLEIYSRTFGTSRLNYPADVPERRLSLHLVIPRKNVSSLYLIKLPNNPDTHKVLCFRLLTPVESVTRSFLDAHRSPPLIYESARWKLM